MKFGAIFAACILLFSAFALVMPDNADAARMGGGRSFGSKPFMSTPAKPPAMRQQPTGTTQRAGANAANASKPGMFGGMGGLFGGLLAGTLLGSLLSGGGFSGGGFMDLILMGLLIFVAYKLFTRFRTRQAQEPAPAGAGGMFAPNQNTGPEPMQRSSAQGTGWDTLRNASSGAMPADIDNNIDVPADFNVEEFLQGAKMVYNRMQKSWDQRDIKDIEQFATPTVVDELKAQAAREPEPSHTEIMLVNARLLGVENEGDNQRAQVYFDVLMRENPSQQVPSSAREIWHFVRTGQTGNWQLDGIQQVD